MMGNGAATDLRRSRRLAGLGARVVELTHEIAVPLGLIVGSLETLEAYVGLLAERAKPLEAAAGGMADDPALRHALAHSTALLRICRQGTAQLGGLLDQLSDFAREPDAPIRPAAVDVARVLRTTAELVARAARDAPAIAFHVDDLPAVTADESALSRAFVDLWRHVFDALVETPRARVIVRAACRIDVSPTVRRTWVEIAIEDNGPAIRADERGRAFEPFFTRRPNGAPPGLGLAAARDVLEAQGCEIALLPESESGATFLIRLPVRP